MSTLSLCKLKILIEASGFTDNPQAD